MQTFGLSGDDWSSNIAHTDSGSQCFQCTPTQSSSKDIWGLYTDYSEKKKPNLTRKHCCDSSITNKLSALFLILVNICGKKWGKGYISSKYDKK